MKRSLAPLVLAVLAALTGCDLFKPEELKSEPGRFSVTMPRKSSESTQTVNTAAGAITLHRFMAQKANVSYAVMYSDFPQQGTDVSDPERILDGARDGAVRELSGQLVSETKITIDGFPGRELQIKAKSEGQDCTMKHRIYLVKYRLYQVIAVAVKTPTHDDEIRDFMNSFHLTKQGQ